MAAMYGVITGIFYVIMATIAYTQVSNITVFYTVKATGYLLLLVLTGLLAARIRKANGGYIQFKDVFGAIIVMMLVSGAIYFIYNYIYIEYIDKQYVYKLKAAMLQWMEKRNTPDDIMNTTEKSFDKQIAESKTFNLGNNVLSYFSNLMLDCLLGLGVAAIIKKNKPFDAKF